MKHKVVLYQTYLLQLLPSSLLKCFAGYKRVGVRMGKSMGIKLDMNKAYDMVEGVLEWMINHFFFPPHFISLLMNCVIFLSF